jgi:glycerate kinase
VSRVIAWRDSRVKIVIAPDSFKGSLCAADVASAIAAGIRQVFPDAILQLMPLADGGEGTLDAILSATHGKRCRAGVRGALDESVSADYGLLDDAGGRLAILESAQVVGLHRAKNNDVMQRSTWGLGELIQHCLAQNVRRFMIGLGGSSTNDGGTGLLAALGVKFLDQTGEEIAPTAQGLAHLHQADFSHLDARLASSEIILMTDVDNPLCGPNGATAIFGPQKGVRAEEVSILDARLARLAQLGDAWMGSAMSLQPGAGAAGGLGYAFLLLGAQRRPGAEVVCELMQLDAALQNADWLITGEGKSDAQTLHGKLPLVVAHHALRARVPVLLLSGVIEASSRAALEQIFNACYALVEADVTAAYAMSETARCLVERARQIAQSMPGPAR